MVNHIHYIRTACGNPSREETPNSLSRISDSLCNFQKRRKTYKNIERVGLNFIAGQHPEVLVQYGFQKCFNGLGRSAGKNISKILRTPDQMVRCLTDTDFLRFNISHVSNPNKFISDSQGQFLPRPKPLVFSLQEFL